MSIKQIIYIRDYSLLADENGYSEATHAEIEAGVNLFARHDSGEYFPWKFGEQKPWHYPAVPYMPEATAKIYRQMCDEWTIKNCRPISAMSKGVVQFIQNEAVEEAKQIAKEKRQAEWIADSFFARLEPFVVGLVAAGVLRAK